jgi:hypothetical protein
MSENDVETVESFIQRLHDSEILIDEKAHDIWLTKYDMGQQPEKKNLSDVLALMIENYREHRNDEFKNIFAKFCAQWLEKAYLYGVVKEGAGISRKLKDCIAEKEILQKTLDEIAERNLQLEFQNQDLRSQLEQSDKFQKVFRQQNK